MIKNIIHFINNNEMFNVFIENIEFVYIKKVAGYFLKIRLHTIFDKVCVNKKKHVCLFVCMLAMDRKIYHT